MNEKAGKRLKSYLREKTQDWYDVWMFNIGTEQQEIVLQTDEVIDAKWMSAEEIYNLHKEKKLHPLLDLKDIIKD